MYQVGFVDRSRVLSSLFTLEGPSKAELFKEAQALYNDEKKRPSLVQWLKINQEEYSDSTDLWGYLTTEYTKVGLFEESKFQEFLQKSSSSTPKSNDLATYEEVLKNLGSQIKEGPNFSEVFKNYTFEELKKEALKGWGWSDDTSIHITDTSKFIQLLKDNSISTQDLALLSGKKGDKEPAPQEIIDALNKYFNIDAIFQCYHLLGGSLDKESLINLFRNKPQPWGWGSATSFSLSPVHIHDIADFLWQNTKHASDQEVIDTLQKPIEHKSTYSSIEFIQNLQVLLQSFQTNLSEFWASTLGGKLLDEFDKDLQPIKQLANNAGYKPLIKWTLSVMNSEVLKNYVKSNEKDLKKWINEIAPFSGALNPPPKGSELESVYNILANFNGSQDWGRFWIGKKPLFSGSLERKFTELETLITQLKTINNTAKSGLSYEKIKAEIDLMEKEHSSLSGDINQHISISRGIGLQNYVVDKVNVVISFRDLIFSDKSRSIEVNGEQKGPLVSIYNRAVKGDQEAINDIKVISKAIEQFQNKKSYKDDLKALNECHNKIMHDLLDPSSEFFSHLLTILIANPKILDFLPQAIRSDLENVITHNVAANYVWSVVIGKINSSYFKWVKFLTTALAVKEKSGNEKKRAEAEVKEIAEEIIS